MKNQSFPKPGLTSSLIYGGVCLLFLLFISSGWMNRLENSIYDAMMRTRGQRTPSDQILIISMDEKSARVLNKKKGGWSRRNMARVIRNLTNAGAEVIGIDLIFSAASADPAADRELATAIYESENVVLAKYLDMESGEIEQSIPAFRQGMIGDGIINMPMDSHVLRRIPAFYTVPQAEGLALHILFALDIARCFLYLDYAPDLSHEDYFKMGSIEIPYPDLIINYAGPAGTFQRISYWQAVRGILKKEMVSGKICLLGTTRATDQDFKMVPCAAPRFPAEFNELKKAFPKLTASGGKQLMPGIEIHANILQNILQGRYIRDRKSDLFWIAVAVVCILSVLFYCSRIKVVYLLILFVCAFTAYMISGYVLFVRNLVWVPIAAPLSILTLHFGGGISCQVISAKLARRKISRMFGTYVSRNVARQLIDNPEFSVEGRTETVTVLFSDIRGFTTLSEALNPQQVGYFLNHYFSRMLDILFQHDGTLDKLMGDAVMGFFGAPIPMNDHAKKAAETALLMAREIPRIREEIDIPGREHLSIGIGLNTGPVVVGNLGSRTFADYTVIGDTVNTGSRLEGMNKMYGTQILCGPVTAERIRDDFILRNIDAVRVKGRHEPVEIYELSGRKEEGGPGWHTEFERGLKAYRKKEFEKAERIFAGLKNRDPVSRLYEERCATLIEYTPADWDYVFTATSK